MAEDINKELLKLKVRIGNSFLRAFYPIDYRSNQNILRNIDILLDKETLGLRTLSSSTSQLNVKLGRILTGINSDLDKMQKSLDGLENSIQTGDDVLGNRIDQLEKASSSLLDFLAAAGGYEAIRRLREARNKGKGKGGGRGGPPPPTRPGDDADRDKKKKGKYKLPKGLGILGLAWGLWTLWDELQGIDPNTNKDEYKKAVYTVVSKAVASMGLMWVGAFLGAMVGGAIGFGAGAIPGFIAGLIGGAIADYTLGDSVDQLVEEVVNYLYTGEEEAAASEEGPPPLSDSTMLRREEAPAPELQTPEQQVSEQVSDIQALVAPPIPGPTPPAPPMEQTIAGPVEYPGEVPPVDLQPFAPAADESSRAKAAASEAASKSQIVINTSAAANTTVAEQLYGGGQEQPQSSPYSPVSDTKASINTSSDQAGGLTPGENITTGGAKLNFQLAGKNRSGMPDQDILSLVSNAAAAVGMAQITVTSGKGNYISDAGKKKGQKTTVHSTGKAVDVVGFESHEQKVAFAQTARSMGAGGIGAYKDDVIHVDLGATRHWNWGDPKFPAMAEGGKVSKPTLALIGEAGEPEYVVPQSKAIKFAHEMIAARPTYRTKKHTHLLVVPIMT